MIRSKLPINQPIVAGFPLATSHGLQAVVVDSQAFGWKIIKWSVPVARLTGQRGRMGLPVIDGGIIDRQHPSAPRLTPLMYLLWTNFWLRSQRVEAAQYRKEGSFLAWDGWPAARIQRATASASCRRIKKLARFPITHKRIMYQIALPAKGDT